MNKKVLDALSNFGRVQRELADYGASDTEPDAEWHTILRDAMLGKDFKPRTAEEWELFTASMPCKRAAQRLNAAARKAHEAIQQVQLKDIGEIDKYMKDYAWRVYW